MKGKITFKNFIQNVSCQLWAKLLDVTAPKNRHRSFYLPISAETDSLNLSQIGCLKSASTQEQSDLYWDLMERKQKVDEKAEQNRCCRQFETIYFSFASAEAGSSLQVLYLVESFVPGGKFCTWWKVLYLVESFVPGGKFCTWAEVL
jgi:hypothetical protein